MDLKEQGLTIVEFYAKWCAPCKLMTGSLQKSTQGRDDVKVVRVDCDKDWRIAAENDVSQIPALHYYLNGKRASIRIGNQSVGAIDQEIERIQKNAN